MKNFKVLLILLLTLGITSCEKDDIYEIVDSFETIQLTSFRTDTIFYENFKVALKIKIDSIQESENLQFKVLYDTVNRDTLVLNNNSINRIISDSYNISNYYLELDVTTTLNALKGTVEHQMGSFIYTHNGEMYLLKSGSGDYREVGELGHPILFKKIEGKWGVLKEFFDVKFEAPRNYTFLNDEIFVIGDADENSDGSARYGDIYLAKIINDDIIWTKVNSENTQGFFHSISIGDVTHDGLPDIIGDGFVFTQRNNGTFDYMYYNDKTHDGNAQDGLVKFYPRAFGGAHAIGDLNNDGINEIVEPLNNGDSNEENINGLWVYSYDESLGKYDLVFKSNEINSPYSVFSGERHRGVYVEIKDLNNDGLKDILFSSEGSINGDSVNEFMEIWINQGDFKFKQDSIIYPSVKGPWVHGEIDKGRFANFRTFDINNDGYLDILMQGMMGRGTSIYNENQGIGENKFWKGFTLNNLIWINDGNGKFKKITEVYPHIDTTFIFNEGLGDGWIPDNLYPYINENENLSYLVFGADWDGMNLPYKIRIYDIEIPNLY